MLRSKIRGQETKAQQTINWSLASNKARGKLILMNSQKTMRRNKHKCSAVAATATSSSSSDDDDEGISREGACDSRNNDSRNINTVVVGIKLDAQSKELLTWALVKVAAPGDRVYAIHVVPGIL